MKFGVIGYGSIGKRHVENLISLGYKDIKLLRNVGEGNQHQLPEFNTFSKFAEDLDAIVLANPTSLHYRYLKLILKKNINVLVEKPLVGSTKDLKLLSRQMENYNAIGMIGYNMRFHPCIIKTQKELMSKKLGRIYSARFFVGQHLPDWRDGAKYYETYSANVKLGGGVLLDLIHEIDLAHYLIGAPSNSIKSEVSKSSSLQISTEDIAEILYRTEENSLVSIHLDYLTRGYKRYIEIIAERGTIFTNLHSKKFNITIEGNKRKSTYFPQFSKNDMYVDLLRSFINAIKNKKETALGLKNGILSNKIALSIREKYYEGIKIK